MPSPQAQRNAVQAGRLSEVCPLCRHRGESAVPFLQAQGNAGQAGRQPAAAVRERALNTGQRGATQ